MKNSYVLGIINAIAVVVISIFAFVMPAVGQEKKPNIVLMLADNLGYGDLGSYGGGEIRGAPTPRLDELASGGMRFTHFLVEPACTPSRAALMTGRYSIRAGLSLVAVAGTPNTLSSKEVTMARMFKEAGYNTAMLGKWHLGIDKQSLPQNQGFDEFWGFLDSTDDTLIWPGMKMTHNVIMPESAQPQILQANAGEKLKKIKPYTLEERRTIDLEMADRAVNYIKAHASPDKPFFLYIAWSRVHYPNLPSKGFEGKSRVGNYGDSLMELDYNVGRVLDAVKEKGIENNTIVVFCSDNGPEREVVWTLGGMMGDGGLSGPFRGELGDPWEGSVRTVGMIKWPGKIKPRASNEMFSIMDFFPTLATFAGAKAPTDRPIDGIDQSAYLLSKQEKGNRNNLITFIGDQIVAVRWRQFSVYMVDTISTGSGPGRLGGVGGAATPMNGYPAIYNIELDPREEHNLSAMFGWLGIPVGKVIMDYKATLQKYPNPPAPNLTKW
jgi:arylsulfatase A-like enzyme